MSNPPLARCRSKAVLRAAVHAAVALFLAAPLLAGAPRPVGAEAAATVFPDNRWAAWAAHVDLLGRQPDPRWWDAAVARLDGGAPLATVYRDLVAGSDWQAIVAPVVRLYGAYFLRLPDADGVPYWIDQRQAGVPLDAVSAAFAASGEFHARYGQLGDGAFVDLVYRNVLGRAPEAPGRAFWVDQLRQGRTRGQLMVGFAESPENRARTAASTEVAAVIVSLLRRAPDPAAFDTFVSRRKTDVDIGAIAAEIVASDEYRARWAGGFAPAPSPQLRVALFGDSLAWEAGDYLAWMLHARSTIELRQQAAGGAAPCDFFSRMEDTVASWRPNVVVVAFSGNAMSSCMRGFERGAAYADKYLADARHYADVAAQYGARVVFVSPPATRTTRGIGHPVQLAYAQVAAERPATASWAYGGADVSPGDVYHDFLPCVAGEACMGIAVDGVPQNQVRHPDGVHFCPTGAAVVPGARCDVHSPGAQRYAATIATALRLRFG